MVWWEIYIDTEEERWFEDYFDEQAIIDSDDPEAEYLKQLRNMLTKDPRGINLSKTLLKTKTAKRYLYRKLADKLNLKPKNLKWAKIKKQRLTAKTLKIRLSKAQAKRMAQAKKEKIIKMVRPEVIKETATAISKLNEAEIRIIRQQLKEHELKLKQVSKREKQVMVLEKQYAELGAKIKALKGG